MRRIDTYGIGSLGRVRIPSEYGFPTDLRVGLYIQGNVREIA